MSESAIEMQGICKSFGGVPVLTEVDFTLRKGEIHSLLGGNGAGKSTLMKIMTGVYTHDRGQIRIDGEPSQISSPGDAMSQGISMIFQELSLVPTLTVAENIFLNHELSRNLRLDKKRMEREARQLLDSIGLDIDVHARIENLDVGMCQLVEVVKALSRASSVLVMDEPTASLSEEEAEVLFGIMRRLTGQGVSIVYISHKLKEVLEISDRISVLRDGRIAAVFDRHDFDLKSVIGEIMGRVHEDDELAHHGLWAVGEETLMVVRDLTWPGNEHRVSFELHKGEVLGIVGLLGSGRTEIVEALFGLRDQGGGSVELDGRQARIRTPQDAIRLGIALIPEDRRRQGLVLSHTVKDNLALPNLSRVVQGLRIRDKALTQLAVDCIRQFNVKTRGPGSLMLDMSGGNQQKVVIAKWFKTEPRVLLLDEPTAGVDVSAKTEIVDMVRQFAKDGRGAIFISSELSEVMAVCDRVLILEKGQIKSVAWRAEIENEEALQYALQH